jgi:DNA invertase Pin-like site-specific DNA recombinase
MNNQEITESSKGSTQIKKQHLTRKAAIYLRQSTSGAEGIKARRQAHIDTAIEFGWQKSAVVVIEDFAPGAAEETHRPGLQRLQRLIQSREIGAVITADLTRIGRVKQEVDQFITLCGASDCVLIFGNVIVSPLAA